MNIEAWYHAQPVTGKGLPYKVTADGQIIAGFRTLKEAESAIEMYRSLQGRDPNKDKKVRIYTWEITC